MTRPFKILSITDANITIDTGNCLITFRNTLMKPYYCYIKDSNISNPKIINNLAENPTDKLTNKEIPTPFDYLKPERPCH